jgi:hypothetical protein
MAQRVIDFFNHEIQGGLENVAHSLVIRDSVFTTTYVNKSGIHLLTVFIQNRAAEVLILYIMMMGTFMHRGWPNPC